MSSIESGGLKYDAAWLRCLAAASFKENEALVKINAQEVPESPLAFFVDADLVKANKPLPHEDVEAEVQVVLLDRRNGTAVVEVLGEAISFGPKVVVSSSDLA